MHQARPRHDKTIPCHPTYAMGRAWDTSNTIPSGSLSSAVANFERDRIIDALKSTQGNIAAAARLLATSERILGLRVKKYGIQPKQYR
ncbi:MAG: hypothetical protein KAV83_09830 [Desulfobacterales bacterium]|nr:hypothetical protein [Desulfobacterales bacterium]